MMAEPGELEALYHSIQAREQEYERRSRHIHAGVCVSPRLFAMLRSSPSLHPAANAAAAQWQARLATAEAALQQQEAQLAALVQEKHQLLLAQRLAPRRPTTEPIRAPSATGGCPLLRVHHVCDGSRDVLAQLLGQVSHHASKSAAQLMALQTRGRQLEASAWGVKEKKGGGSLHLTASTFLQARKKLVRQSQEREALRRAVDALRFKHQQLKQRLATVQSQ